MVEEEAENKSVEKEAKVMIEVKQVEARKEKEEAVKA